MNHSCDLRLGGGASVVRGQWEEAESVWQLTSKSIQKTTWEVGLKINCKHKGLWAQFGG